MRKVETESITKPNICPMRVLKPEKKNNKLDNYDIS